MESIISEKVAINEKFLPTPDGEVCLPDPSRLIEIDRYERIAVYDGMFSEKFVEGFYTDLLKLAYKLEDYDSPETKHIKHWKFELPKELWNVYEMFHVIKVVRQIYTKHFPEYKDLEIGRIHSNLHMYGDMQNQHTDCDPREGLTALYYANCDWDQIYGGETIFNDAHDEPAYAIAPRPGRLIMFPGHITHRAGVPNRSTYAARISVAIKTKVRFDPT